MTATTKLTPFLFETELTLALSLDTEEIWPNQEQLGTSHAFTVAAPWFWRAVCVSAYLSPFHGTCTIGTDFRHLGEDSVVG